MTPGPSCKPQEYVALVQHNTLAAAMKWCTGQRGAPERRRNKPKMGNVCCPRRSRGHTRNRRKVHGHGNLVGTFTTSTGPPGNVTGTPGNFTRSPENSLELQKLPQDSIYELLSLLGSSRRCPVQWDGVLGRHPQSNAGEIRGGAPEGITGSKRESNHSSLLEQMIHGARQRYPE